MNIIPAIDLKLGKCVRLYQGCFEQEKYYDIDPTTLAQQYEKEGAKYLHIVDLCGVEQNNIQQLQQIIKIKQNCNLRLQIGGGIRAEQQIQTLLSKGIDRVVIGTMAMTEIEVTKTWIEKFGTAHIVLALDIKVDNNEPILVSHGWRTNTEQSLWDLLNIYSQYKNIEILCTDVSRDGTLKRPNFNLYKQCQKYFPEFRFQASGGIAGLNDLFELSKINVFAAIVGKALFEYKFSLKQAINKLK